MPVSGWKLDDSERERLLARFPPGWPDVIADHITLDGDARQDDPLPQAEDAEIVGGISDGTGLQALVVSIEGTTERPDGSTYHITWSLDRKRGREPAESNEVLAVLGWRPLNHPVLIKIRPSRL